MFPHYNDLDFIYIKAALQTSSKDTSTSLHTNNIHVKLNTNNYFSIRLIYTWLVLKKCLQPATLKLQVSLKPFAGQCAEPATQPEHSKVMAPMLKTIAMFVLH